VRAKFTLFTGVHMRNMQTSLLLYFIEVWFGCKLSLLSLLGCAYEEYADEFTFYFYFYQSLVREFTFFQTHHPDLWAHLRVEYSNKESTFKFRKNSHNLEDPLDLPNHKLRVLKC